MSLCTENSINNLNFFQAERLGLVLPFDLAHVRSRRDAISFESCSSVSKGKPRLKRRGAISFDKTDKQAVYVRQLGDVRIQASRQDIIHQYILNSLQPSDRKCLQNLSSPSYRTRCGSRFLTLGGMKRRKRCRTNPGVDGQSLVDDFYTSSTSCLLDRTSDWSFDVFQLNHSSNGRPLLHVILKLFQQHNLMDHFNLDIVKLMKFANLVEEGYHQNPYHNVIHAADVTQAMHCYITQEKIARHLSPLETMIALVAAITHDLDHPGVNQAFLIATSNHLASLYKNNSVLENHHWRSAVGVLLESGLFDHLPMAVRNNIIKQMKSLILATDMTRQQEFYTRLKTHVLSGDLDMSRSEHRHFILQIALKCADISNPCRSWATCKMWSNRVCDEFFQQGDYERKLSLPVTNLCDRFTNKVSSIQTGFINFVVEPLFKEFSKFMPCAVLTEQLNNMYTNRRNWETILKEEQLLTNNVALTKQLDINSNIEDTAATWACLSDSDSDVYVSCDDSEVDEAPCDITDIHCDIALVAERMDWVDNSASDRRPSLPALPTLLNRQEAYNGRRESFPLIHDNRRTALPQPEPYRALSFDRLVETLTCIDWHLPREKKSSLNLDNLRAEPRLSTLSPNIQTSLITNYLASEELLSK